MQVCVLGSGSGGNAIYVASGRTEVLVDAGLSGTQIQTRMRQVGVDPSRLSAMVVTHEHVDHVRGIEPLTGRLGLRVYLTEGTLGALSLPLNGSTSVQTFENDRAFVVGDLEFQPFSIPHDAADPIGLCVSDGRVQVGIATDLGFVSGLVRQRLSGADLVILEANYDEGMLMSGPYPWPLKQRIRGRAGHLSNHEAATTMVELAQGGVGRAILAHLSKENNTPSLACETVEAALRSAGVGRFWLSIASQDQVGQRIEI